MSPSSTSSSDPRLPLVGADDEIVVPEDLVGARRALAAAIVALFLATCVATLVVDVVWPAPKQIAIGAELERENALARDARFLDGTLAAHTERRLRMTSRVRRTVASPYALWLYQALGYTHGEIIAGKQGWLFSEGRTALGYQRSALEWQVDSCVVLLSSLERRLAAHGVRLVVMPIPRKEVVCAEFLPRGLDPHAWVGPRLIDGLRARCVETVDLAAAWSAAELEHPPYHVAGSHWTSEAESVAAEATARELGVWVPPQDRSTQLIWAAGSAPEWDLLTMAGVDVQVAREAVDSGWLKQHQVLDTSTRTPVLPSAPIDSAEIAVVGTSFTAERGFPRLLSHFANEPVAKLSELGGEPSRSLVKLLEARGGVLPRTIVFELPTHMLFSGGPFPGLAGLYGALPTPAHRALLPLRTFDSARAQLDALTHRPVAIALLARGLLAYDGQGLAQVLLRGKPGAEGVLVTLRTGSINRAYVWPAGAAEFVAPLLTDRMSWGETHVLVSAVGAAASLEFTGAETIALASRVEHSFGEVVARQSSGVWRATFAPRLAALQRHGAGLMLRAVQPDAKVGAVEASLVARAGDIELLRRTFQMRAGETRVVVDLCELAGRDGLSLSLECESHRVVVKSAEIVAIETP